MRVVIGLSDRPEDQRADNVKEIMITVGLKRYLGFIK